MTTSYVYSSGQLRGLKLITPPAQEPLSLEEARAQCRIDADVTADDELIEDWITEAREKIEEMTGLSLVEQTWELAYNGAFEWNGGGIALPKPPVISVASYVYIDQDGNEQTLAVDQYTLDNSIPRRPLLVPVYGVTWPAIRSQPGALKIRYVAGYARAGSPPEMHLVPKRLVNLMKVFVSFRNENRESADLPPGFENALRAQRVEGFA